MDLRVVSISEYGRSAEMRVCGIEGVSESDGMAGIGVCLRIGEHASGGQTVVGSLGRGEQSNARAGVVRKYGVRIGDVELGATQSGAP